MTAMIQIRNVPDALHRRLKSRAALAGMSLWPCSKRFPPTASAVKRRLFEPS
jgi:hypothetical protein